MPPRLTEANLNDPITQHMRREFTGLRGDQTVGEALAAMREQPPEGRIIYFYVTDASDRLVGVVPTRRLLLSPLDKPIVEIMVRQVIAIPNEATVLDACEFFTLHRLLAFPVVDAERRLVGVVDVELYTEELSEAAEHAEAPPAVYDDLFQLIGVHVAQARQTSPWQAFRMRFPWLGCNIAGGILAAFLSWLYRAELQRVVALALFIPAVLALAESVATQSVSLALRMLHGQRPKWWSLMAKLRAEAGAGFLLGSASGVVVAAVALVWLGQPRVGLCLLTGIVGGVTGSALLGIAIPSVLHLLRRDPQVAAGPIALASADVMTLLLYLNLARWLSS